MLLETCCSVIFLVVLFYDIVLLIKQWDRLKSYAKILFVILMFTGIGPFIVLPCLLAGIGEKKH